MLKVDNLSYAYSDKYLFENLGFHLDIKTIIKISGSNGSGKTTFLKNIAGILKNYEGNIYFKDENIKDMSFPKDKRLNFNVWFDKENALILKVTYSRMGNWEYRVKNYD